VVDSSQIELLGLVMEGIFRGGHVRVFRFVDILGCEIHTINDPEHLLPIPEIWQIITIGFSRMRVESVVLKRTDSSEPSVYNVRVRLVPAATAHLFKN